MTDSSKGPATAADAAEGLGAGELTSAELTRSARERADRLDSAIGAFALRFDEYAVSRAAESDERAARGLRRALDGISIGVKDNLRMSQGPTRAHSLVLAKEWSDGPDASVVTALKEAGAVIPGKTALSEFALGTADPSKPFPIPRNPWNLNAWPGGSSSGTAVGISAGLFLGGLGTDTGGSIRVPAAFCGITGFKPTYGLVPVDGCVPLGFTLDTIGPMAASAEDCRMILDTIARPRQRTASEKSAAALRDPSLRGVRIGVAREDHFGEESDPKIEQNLDEMIRLATSLGAVVTDVALPGFRTARVATMAMSQAEGFAYHRRNLQRRWNDYYESTRERLALGALMTGADYVQAQRFRRATIAALATVFGDVDVIFTPTATISAPLYGNRLAIDTAGLVQNVHTGYWSFVGLPTIAMPMGPTSSSMPSSLQVAGRAFEDHYVLGVCQRLQEASDWHLHRPPEPFAPPRELTGDAPEPARSADGFDSPAGAVEALLAVAGLPASAAEIARLDQLYAGLLNDVGLLYECEELFSDLPPAFDFAAG